MVSCVKAPVFAVNTNSEDHVDAINDANNKLCYVSGFGLRTYIGRLDSRVSELVLPSLQTV